MVIGWHRPYARWFCWAALIAALPHSANGAIISSSWISGACSKILGTLVVYPKDTPSNQTHAASVLFDSTALTRLSQNGGLSSGHWIDAAGLVADEISYAQKLTARRINELIAKEDLSQLVNFFAAFDLTLTLSDEDYFKIAAQPIAWDKMLELIRFGFDASQGTSLQSLITEDLLALIERALLFDYIALTTPHSSDSIFKRYRKRVSGLYFALKSRELRDLHFKLLMLKSDLKTMKDLHQSRGFLLGASESFEVRQK